ncbi:aminodeoxychorismate lyase [Acidihalobacter aeolianus]|uniref:Aminodeoxychorismate lyase n=1 Tax=Acidihalobacter aeolianus TaxID=2792603 RepID=A0A1D8K7P3_9GAMM|nr:aminodeoxychorismate lyase [Acidihalobacter aeolianus]AOV16962.1 aminodeoxychorismate lyase [Acidihalobacter aeolianus]
MADKASHLDSCVPISDRGLAYGHGVFETLEARDGQLPHWPRHWRRLTEGCRRLHLHMPMETELLPELLRASPPDGRHVVKLVYTAGDGERGYRIPSELTPRLLIDIRPWPIYPSSHTLKGVAVRLCHTRLPDDPALAGIKHLNRLHQVLARAEWDDDTIVEGLLADSNGNLVEGSMSNLFWIEGDRLLTPDLDRCGVAGIMRERILDWARANAVETSIETLEPERLHQADGALLCNSLIGIWPVRRIETQDMPPFPPLIGTLCRAVREGTC